MNKRILALLGAVVICVLGACGEKPASPDTPSAPAVMGTKVLELRKNEDGLFPVTVEAISAQMTGVKTLSFEAVPDLGESPDPYLKNSYQMAALVTGTPPQSGDEYLHPNDEKNCCLLLFDGDTHLSGLFVGVPERDGDVCRMEVKLMDYDFSALVESEKAAFGGATLELGQYIEPYEAARSGARWYLEGYETGTGGDILEDPIQTYHLWHQVNSENFRELCLDVLRFDFSHAEGEYVGYLLFDKEFNPVGHTVVRPVEPGPVVKAPKSSSTLNFDLQLGPDGTAALGKELLDLAVINLRSVSAYYTAPLSDDLDDYILQSDAAPAAVAGWEQFENSINFDPKREDEVLCLLLFDNSEHLMGWYVGQPRQIGADRYSLRIEMCDYDFSAMLAEKKAAFEAEREAMFARQFTVDEARGSAAYVVRGFGVNRGEGPESDVAGAFRLWCRLHAPQPEMFALPPEALVPDADQRSFDMPYLLLDKDLQPIGWTSVTPQE